MTVPYLERYFEDYAIGESAEFGDHLLDEAQIVAFARQFDPQPFHTDPVAAVSSVFGGLIASGMHTASLMTRLMVDHFISRLAGIGSAGVDEMRWVKPVRPGDRLSMRITVIDLRPSASRADRGTVFQQVEMLNQAREVVMTCKSSGMYRRRAPAKAQT